MNKSWFELFKMECMYGDSLNEEDEVQVFNEVKDRDDRQEV